MIEKNLKNWLQENILNKDKSICIDLEDIKFESLTNDLDICVINNIDIGVNNCGAISHIFKSITLNIQIKKYKNRNDMCEIKLSYSYEHTSGGTNGYDVSYFSKDMCNTFYLI